MTRLEYIQNPASTIEHPRRPAHLTRRPSLSLLRRSKGCEGRITHQSVRAGFTLIELLIVVGIIGLLLVLIAPAFTTIKGGNDVTSAAYNIQGVLDAARTYAKANNTYTWVGFFEEDAPPQPPASPALPGTGRVVVSIIASANGTMPYTGNLSDNSQSNPVVLDPAPAPSPVTLIQVGKLTKIDNVHLKLFTATPGPPFDTYDTRPVAPSTAQISDDAPPSPSLVFHYPLFSSDPASQYKFQKIVQFSPRGEGVIDNSSYAMAPVSEIGIQPTHGTTVDTASTNFVAIQFTGFGGNVKIYRK
jgi:prepilin-type N-terminal cleavage/methylation domain-containing protein